MSEMQELKPLPCWHCETADTITTELDALTGYKWGYAACSCGARGPDVRTGYDGGSQAAWRVEAITAWNTRPREAALEAEVERLRVALKDCADDLEAEILARANSELPRRIDRDLETVRVARQALSPNNPAGQAMEGDHG